MKTGQLNKRITFQTYTTVKDKQGVQSKTWSDFVTVFANVKTGSLREVMQGDRLVAQAKITFTIRYRKDLTPDMRIVYEGKALPINGIADLDGTNQFLTVEVMKGQNT